MKTVEYVQMFGSPDGKRLLQKALTTSITSGGPAIEEHLETIITNEMVRLVPELAVIETKYDPQDIHRFSRLVDLPAPGSAMGQNSVTPTTSSQLEKATTTMKVMKCKGSVTGLLKAAASKNYDMVEMETENQIQAFANDLVTYLYHGNKDADAYTFDGWNKFIATYRKNETWGGTVPASLAVLDGMIDSSNRRKGQPHRRCFVMSPEMLTKLSGFYTNIRDNRDANNDGTNALMINGGWRLQTYRGIPILESSSTRPLAQMTAVTAGHAGAGSALADKTRYFQVAPVTWDGEQIASAQVSDTSSSSDTVTLSWTAYPKALFYYIYCSETTGQAKLTRVIAAKNYDGDGTPTTAVTGITFATDPLTANDSVPTHMQDDRPFNYTGGIAPETIYLLDLDTYQGMGKFAYTNEDGGRLDGLVSVIPLAKVDDHDDFLLKCYGALIDAFEATCGMHRGLRVA